MISVINNIDLFKLKNIYDELYKKENKFNNNFSFYFFIKIMDYLANHLTLVKELNENAITSQIIDNLALAINCSDDINYEELVNYKLVYKNKINSLNSIFLTMKPNKSSNSISASSANFSVMSSSMT